MGADHPWHRRSRIVKGLSGWACYQLSAWVALFFPVAVDRAMYQTLREQFEPSSAKDGPGPASDQ